MASGSRRAGPGVLIKKKDRPGEPGLNQTAFAVRPPAVGRLPPVVGARDAIIEQLLSTRAAQLP